MTPRTRTFWLLGHRWIGIILGLLIVLIGITGALLEFEDALDTALNPSLYNVQPGETYLPYDVLVAAAADGHTDLKSGYFSRNNDTATTPVIVTMQGARSEEVQVFVNPYTAEVIGHRSGLSSIALIRRLHGDLALGDVGEDIIGVVSVLISVLCLMGLVLWWPGRGAWTRSLKINWTSRPRLVLRDLHNAGGAYLFIFLLLSAITVPPIIWKLTTPQGGPPQTGQQARETSPPSGGPPTSISWQAAVDAAKAAVPGQWVGFVLRPLGPAPFYMIRVWPPGETGTPQMTTVFVNRYTGSIIRISSPSSLTLTRLISSDYLISLHSGAIAGLPGRLIMFIAGLGFAVLFASGLATWLIRLSSKNKSRSPSDITN
ncbi:MAG: PepSY-associated TM helix domain-containing protein [Rhodospirillales bacterium]|jgi:uncharacterized iron-regulated membrane protein